MKPLTIDLEALIRASAALEAVHALKVNEPIPFEMVLQVAGAVGFMRSAMQQIGRQPIEVKTP